MSGFEFEFDFDHWSRLAQDNPAAYFRERERLIARFIESCPPEQIERMREMQHQIDALRASAGSPMHAVRQMMSMMEDHLEALQMQMRALRNESDRLRTLVDSVREA